MKKNIDGLLCWCGVSLSISAYLLLNTHVITATSLAFLCMNVLSATLIGYTAFRKKMSALVAQNVIWLSITVIGFFQAGR